MDQEQVTRFFGRLYQPGQHFELVAVKDGQARRKTFEWVGQTPVILSALEGFEALGYNLYASVLPLERQEIGGYDRIWIDRDDPSAPWPFGADDNWNYVQWPEPTTLVRTSEAETGFRWQAIWKLDQILPEKEARDTIKRLAQRGVGDTSVHDPRRVFRIPGLMNAKRGSVSRLLSTFPEEVSVATFDLDAGITEAGVTLDHLMQMDLQRPHEVLGEWLAGVSEGDRARKAYVTGRFLKSCGVTFDDALIIVATGARRAEPALSDAEVTHAVRSAYHKD
jgi:hypothetical protein